MVDLRSYNNDTFYRGEHVWKEFIWRIIQQSLFNIEWLKLYKLKYYLLKQFNADIKSTVIIKPKTKITFPWRLAIGENSWIGEETWLLNLDRITIGENVCISQRSFLCTGSHDWTKSSFDLITKPINIENGVWICANVFIGPGVTIGENSIIKPGSVVSQDLPPNMIHGGNPCVPLKKRPKRINVQPTST